MPPCPPPRYVYAGNNKTYLGLHVRCPIFLFHFTKMWFFSTDFRKFPKPNFTKIRPVGAEPTYAKKET